MRYDGLLIPISEEEPCGPDLDEIGDDDFLNYTLGAEDRFPARYYDIDSGAPFDRASIDLKAEVAIISGLLEKSRDLRLLGIEARFQALSGQISGFAECLQAMAGLLSAFWPDVHPKAYGSDFTMRQNTVSALSGRSSVIFPLHNAPIVRDRRHGPVTWRHQAIVMGDATPLPGAKALGTTEIAEALSNPDNAAQVSATHADVMASLKALGTIHDAFVEGAGFEYAPDFDELRDTLEKIGGLIETHVPSLVPEDRRGRSAPGAGAAEDGGAEDGSSAASPAGAQGQSNRAVPAVVIPSHAAAVAALGAAERYFATKENSSPALILVSQARQLIGKPFVVAMQELVSDLADRAVIRIEPDSGFQLDMNRMRNVTDAFISSDDSIALGEAESFSFVAATRSEASALMLGVEAFLKVAEPSSPVPILLEKARGFLNQDFRSILKSLILR